jgi:acetyl esterase/lipase
MIVSAQDVPYVQHQNIVYGEVHGIGLVMDIFVPTGTKNGLAIVDVVSGAWFSDRGKINDHKKSQTYDKLCAKGYTVFAVRPGSQSKFGALEMRDHLNLGIRWAKDRAKEYAFDTERMGMMGASAGGHLACLTAVTADDGTTVDDKGKTKPDTRVKAVAVFFPPTDFFTYGPKPADPRQDGRLDQIVRRLAFPEGIQNATDEEVTSRLTKISPARMVTDKAPPFLLIHGDADPVVPLKQSETMIESLKKANVPAELIVKPGGVHPWPTIHEEVQIIADWFDKQLTSK